MKLIDLIDRLLCLTITSANLDKEVYFHASINGNDLGWDITGVGLENDKIVLRDIRKYNEHSKK